MPGALRRRAAALPAPAARFRRCNPLTELLEDVGEGGLVVATSWDARRRRVRRRGTLARVEAAYNAARPCEMRGRGRRRARRPLAALRRHGRAGRGRRVAALGPRAPGGRARGAGCQRIARGVVVDCVAVDAAARAAGA